jgi:AraC-like DNA-binding protein
MQSLVQLYMLVAIFCLLLFKSPREIFLSLYLRLLLLLLICISVIKILAVARVLSFAPLVYVISNTALFVFIPAIYLFLRKQMNIQPNTRKDLVHLLPALGYSLTWMSLLIFKNNEALTKADMFNESSVSQGPPLLYFLLFGYGIIGWYLLLVLKIVKDKYGFPKKTEVFSPVGAALMVGEKAEHVHKAELQTGSPYLTEEKILQIDNRIREFLHSQRPFLRHGYSLKQLAEDTELPVHLLSAFINKHYKVNFNDFINEYRVNYGKTKIMNDEWKSKKLEAIAEESGFSNRNTFTAAFKRVTGLNPSEFLKTIKEKQAA